MAAKSDISGLSKRRMPKNLMHTGQEVAKIHLFVYFQDGGCPPSWIGYSPFWTIHGVPLMGCILPANGTMIRSVVIETLRF